MKTVLFILVAVANVPLFLWLASDRFGSEGVWPFLDLFAGRKRPWDWLAGDDPRSQTYGEYQFDKIVAVAYLAFYCAAVASQYHVLAKFVVGIENPWL